jgi:mannitol/fructose-specific phosphotransferase system IIA component (Ntr-type)
MQSGNPSPLRLGDILTTGDSLLRLVNPERDAVLLALVANVPELQDNAAVQETLLKALQEREQLYSTGIGDGIALPHARNALVGLVTRPCIVFGKHERGLDYKSIDGQPVNLLLLLVAPNVTSHLNMLAGISRVLRDARVRRDLLAATTPARVLEIVRALDS